MSGLLRPDQPGWLPPGTARMISMLVVVGTLCALAMRGQEPPQWLLAIGMALIGEYVGRRAGGGTNGG